ncbi:MAG: SusC/RagA family TonB-linked outer membrane protein [Balneolaceae bacterium]
MIKRIQLGLLLSLFLVPVALAQTGSVTGVITDQRTSERLPGVSVVVTELQRGTATNADGEFEITGIPSGTYTLAVTYIGFKRYSTQIQVGTTELTQNIELEEDVFGLEEVVVTGVGTGTQTTKLGFSVSKVGERELSEVPAADPASALRGKVPGITIVQASGDPSAAPDIRLRGSTSISGDQQPLIIVDGVITDGNLRDINMNDVESIEVVKGAAASSLYGSLAGNGVIQVITKRGANQIGRPTFSIRSEYGFSEIADDYPIATKHPYATDDVVLTDDGRFIEDWPSAASGTYDSDRRFDNEYPVYYDNIESVFTSNPYTNHSFSLANSEEKFNYRTSFDNFVQGGVMKPLDDYTRNTVRFNGDYIPNDRLQAKVSASYTTVEAPEVPEQGQGNNYFYSVLTAEPVFDFTETNEDGTTTNNPTGYSALGSNFQNPLYVAEQRQYDFQRDRIIAGFNLQYQLTDFLSAHGRQSLDKQYTSVEEFYPRGYTTPSPSTTLQNGNDWRRKIEESTAITELWFQFEQSYNDFSVSSILKYLYENRNYDRVDLSGYNYPVAGIRNIGSTESSTHDVGSLLETIRAENIILNVDVDYRDKIIVGGMIRRDGSSGFGANERWQTYYRGSIAYRITEDFDINNVDEWKIRASYGIAGNRPDFDAQYETFNASSTGISPGALGNSELKPSTVAEFEVGTNITFLNRFNFETNYALTNVTNDYVEVPLSSVAGFSSQWQNVGEIEATSLEFALTGQIYNTRDFTWGANLTWSKVTQEITSLGGTPAFTRNIGAVPLFRFEAGVPYGTMYGNVALTSLDDLTVVNGEVLNAGIDTNGDGTLTAADYEINQHGYVVPAGTHGTPDEQITYKVDEAGSKVTESIGSTTPDFNVGLSNALNYKGFGLYVLIDWVQGGDVYNYTKQLLYFNNRHADAEKFAEEGFDVGYADGGSAAYNAAQASSYFSEDASYVKLREVALSYTFSNEALGFIGDYVRDLRLSVTGRNLLTFTNYTGWDPEVALRTNATNFRLDEYAYPNYRTFTGAIQISF